MPRVKKTYRISEDTAAEIAAIAERGGVTATEVVEAAIWAYGSLKAATGPSNGEPAASATAASDAAIEALAAQLAAKDAQIEALTSALSMAQQLADQAQRLQASALPPTEERQLVSVPLAPTRLTLRERLTGRLSR